MYTAEELGFILYNNRSVKGVVSNFLPKINPITLIRIENQLSECKNHFSTDNRMVELNINELDTQAEDIIVTPEDISSLTDFFLDCSGLLSEKEYAYLEKRGFGEKTILDWNLVGLSNLTSQRDLEILGVTCHPSLRNVLEDGIENGGILIPLFDKNENLINCAVRKIGIESNGSTRTLKYSLACPDIPVWGLDRIQEKGKEIWLTEGIFDMIALFNLGKKSLSCSSAMWSGIQLYHVLNKQPESLVIFSDKDETGLRTSAILKMFFEMNYIPTRIVVSPVAKDPAEHYFQKNQTLSNLVEIDVTHEMLESHKDESFNFLKYLKNRNFY